MSSVRCRVNCECMGFGLLWLGLVSVLLYGFFVWRGGCVGWGLQLSRRVDSLLLGVLLLFHVQAFRRFRSIGPIGSGLCATWWRTCFAFMASLVCCVCCPARMFIGTCACTSASRSGMACATGVRAIMVWKRITSMGTCPWLILLVRLAVRGIRCLG